MSKTKLEIAHKNSEILKPESTTPETQNLYEVLKELPKPESSMKLSASQKKWWLWFGYEFVKTNQTTKVDLIHLQQAAFWMDARCKAIAEVNSKKGIDGLVQKFASGATNVTGYVSIIEKADKHLAEVSAHFGLSIKDRKKLGAVNSENDNQLSLLFGEVEKMLHG
ncbi:hypothetical protein OD91_0871 [Lutibacter sp. Hel_I_33_5]|uniref:P27 family phage terminase small subunit n=1 Tax=Lutibacter sp. Hel_I_33_5 TaxID=1566289 RepID=UPI0011A4173D|nr:P27 family phage terminase small subunit [Lutibacter sp. Hel_I_33_5]TVZ55616.1 hypothetical protein OD91_0871 [Lutibacter sp. Hel_I_33_5]